MTGMHRAALAAFLGGALTLGAAGTADALTINTTTNQVETTRDGKVSVRFDAVSASFSSDLVLIDAVGDTGGVFLMNNKTTPLGTVVDLGSFLAGTPLVFRLDVLTTGNSFFTGLASDNPLGFIEYALFTENADGSITVGFEDIRGGGDRDFNDLVFTIFEVVETPIPGAVLFMLTGLAGFGAARRLKKSA